MNLPDLLLDIHPLHALQILTLFQLPVVTGRRLLPARGLLLADDGLARDAVEDIAPLRAEPLEVGGHVDGRQVGGRLAEIGLEALLFPAGVEQLDCEEGGWISKGILVQRRGSGDGGRMEKRRIGGFRTSHVLL